MTQSEFEHIAQELRSQMLKVALDFFGSQDDAEDVAQDAMVQLWHYCERIDSGRNVSGLAVRVAAASGRHVRLSAGTLGSPGHTAHDGRSRGTVETTRTTALRDATDGRTLDSRHR